MIGFEKIHWTETHSSGSSKHRKTKTVQFNGENILCNFRITLHMFVGDSVTIGQF